MADADHTRAEKQCCSCHERKPVGDFYRDKGQPDGLYRRCKKCHLLTTSRYAKRHPKGSAGRRKLAEYLVGYYQRNKEKIKEAVRAREKRLGDALKPINAAKAMRRIARKRQATPAWADHAAIQLLYDEAARLTAQTGLPHHVDHRVPLQSRKVCGLHTQDNMEVLAGPENQSKGNRWWPDMWD